MFFRAQFWTIVFFFPLQTPPVCGVNADAWHICASRPYLSFSTPVVNIKLPPWLSSRHLKFNKSHTYHLISSLKTCSSPNLPPLPFFFSPSSQNLPLLYPLQYSIQQTSKIYPKCNHFSSPSLVSLYNSLSIIQCDLLNTLQGQSLPCSSTIPFHLEYNTISKFPLPWSTQPYWTVLPLWPLFLPLSPVFTFFPFTNPSSGPLPGML